MLGLVSTNVTCPYCGEYFEALIDSSEGDSEYTEDCYVCCRPIKFYCRVSDTDQLTVTT
ncbi:MAG: CPXCG motif-containing cysteine-rich protein, partial [Spongiibacteraceae bacterium]